MVEIVRSSRSLPGRAYVRDPIAPKIFVGSQMHDALNLDTSLIPVSKGVVCALRLI